MGLPGGKIVDSMAGGDKALGQLLERLKGEDFEGYIRTTITKDENPIEGFMVFKGGIARIGLYFGGEELRGEGALRQIIADSLSEESLIDIGSYSYTSSSISVDHIIRQYPDAEIDLENLDLEGEIESIREEERRRRSRNRSRVDTRQKRRV